MSFDRRKLRLSATEVMKLPIEERNQILSVAAAEAAEEYENNKDLTDFEAFDDILEYDDYRVPGIKVNWKRARELWKKLQAVIKNEEHIGKPK